MRGRIFLCLLLAFIPAPALADDSPVGISWVQTKDLRLFYYDSLSYLVPHAVRTFTNSLEWQRRMFGWMPSEPTTVLLQDLSDYGGAHAYAAPRATLVFDVAPQSNAFETFPTSERMYALMNHELIHVVQGDIASEEDRHWRRIFLGKVAAQPKNPESLLYSYLTVPRFTAPRWYSEGTAVFFETWMGGGLGRAQGGYDEMVFRAMVRDDAHFYDPLGLASRGTFVDFQIGANAYLYGTRFATWLAYTYSPEKVVAWLRRDEGSARYYSDQFQQVFGIPVEQAWQDWIVFEHDFQRANLAEVRKFPITPTASWLRALWVRYRARITTSRQGRSMAPSVTPASSSTSARSTLATAASGTSPMSSGQCSIGSPHLPTTRSAGLLFSRTTTMATLPSGTSWPWTCGPARKKC